MIPQEVPTLTIKEVEDNFDFVFETLVCRNKMTFRVTTDDGKSVLLMPVLESTPLPEDVMRDLEAMNKAIQQPDVPVGAPPLDMPF